MRWCSHPHLQTCQTFRPNSASIKPPTCTAQPARDGSRVRAAVLRRRSLQEARQAHAGSVTSCRATRCTSEAACPARVQESLADCQLLLYCAGHAKPDLPDGSSKFGSSRSMAARLSDCVACSNALMSVAGMGKPDWLSVPGLGDICAHCWPPALKYVGELLCQGLPVSQPRPLPLPPAQADPLPSLPVQGLHPARLPPARCKSLSPSALRFDAARAGDWRCVRLCHS